MCNEMMKCVQERADIEKEYAKRLKGWAKKWNDSFERGPEYGTNKQMLKGSLEEAVKLADVHLEIKDHLLTDVQTSMKDWRNENYKKQLVGGCKEAKAFEDDFKKAQKPWAKRLEKMMKCKKDYYTACKLEKTAKNQENNARNSTEVSPDQMKKFGEKSEKCRRDVEATRKLYKQSLDELNASNARYVEDMTEVYRRTQDFEEKRLKFFKKFLYDMHACLDLTQKKTIPDIYAQLHQAISVADFANDLKWWSQNRGVEMAMSWPTYEEYVTEFHSINRKERVKSAYLSGSDGVMLTMIQKSEPATDRPTPTAIIPPQPNPATESPSPYGEDEWDDDTGSNRSGVRVKAIYNYEGQEGDELSFKAGEVFLKVKDRDDQGWCTGYKSGRTGLYPENYVEVIGSDP